MSLSNVLGSKYLHAMELSVEKLRSIISAHQGTPFLRGPRTVNGLIAKIVELKITVNWGLVLGVMNGPGTLVDSLICEYYGDNLMDKPEDIVTPNSSPPVSPGGADQIVPVVLLEHRMDLDTEDHLSGGDPKLQEQPERHEKNADIPTPPDLSMDLNTNNHVLDGDANFQKHPEHRGGDTISVKSEPTPASIPMQVDPDSDIEILSEDPERPREKAITVKSEATASSIPIGADSDSDFEILSEDPQLRKDQEVADKEDREISVASDTDGAEEWAGVLDGNLIIGLDALYGASVSRSKRHRLEGQAHGQRLHCRSKQFGNRVCAGCQYTAG